MWGYELDGVLIPNFLSGQATVNRRRWLHTHYAPLFYPMQPFIILTGRLASDAITTNLWLNKVQLEPEIVFHSNEKDDFEAAWKYKLAVLLEHPNITHYLEYDAIVAANLRPRLPGCKIVLWQQMLTANLTNLEKSCE